MAKNQVDLWKDELIRLSDLDFDKTNDLLFNAYYSAFEDILKKTKLYIENYETLTFSKKLEAQRLFAAARDIENILIGANATVDASIFLFANNEILRGYYGNWYKLDNVLQLEGNFAMINQDYINLLIEKGLDGTKFSERLHKNVKQLIKDIEQEIMNSAITGKGYEHIAGEIMHKIEGGYRNALRIARTEGQRLNGESTQLSYERAEEMGVKMSKVWLSAHDTKTRRTHQMLDGQKVGVDDEFENINGDRALYPGGFGLAHEDINCRCTTYVELEETTVSDLNKEYRQYRKTGGSYENWEKELERRGL